MHGRMHICAAATGRGSASRAERCSAATSKPPSTVLESSVALEEDPVVPDAPITSPVASTVQGGDDLGPLEATETT